MKSNIRQDNYLLEMGIDNIILFTKGHSINNHAKLKAGGSQ
jgi:hypothetical protein